MKKSLLAKKLVKKIITSNKFIFDIIVFTPINIKFEDEMNKQLSEEIMDRYGK